MPYVTSIERLGRKEGLQEGRKEEAHAITQNLSAMGMDNVFIGKVTGLSDEEIISLLKQTH
ncbi:MAG: hypothetical protein ON057_001837 [Glomeribacter sp. 1016415]|nr:hypothetical protein [Glomeribacter sp. 1016415]